MEFLSSISASVAADATVSVILVALAIVCFIGLIVFLCRFADYDGKVNNTFVKLAIILAIGFALRMLFAMFIRGYRGDYDLFVTMFNHLNTSGVKGYYTGSASSVLYPIVYFVYLIFGGLSNASGLSNYGLGMQFMIKLPLIIADLFAAVGVYLIAGKYWNKAAALVLTAFACVCPIFFIGSSIWCTPITFTVVFALYMCYFIARKKHACAIAFATAAAFSSKEGIYLFPVIAVFSCYHFVRAIINIKRDKPQGKAVLGSEYSAAISVPIGFVLSLAVAYLFGLIMIHSYNANFFRYIYEFLLYPLTGWKYFTYDGLSIYAIFDRNGAQPAARFPSWLFVCIFAAIIFAVVCIVYFTKRNRATLIMLLGFALLTMQVYYPGSSAVGMQSTFLILLAAYALTRDKRILYVVFVIGLCYIVNSLCALSNMGQLNNLDDYSLSEANLPTIGIKAVGIVCSVFTILAHLYYTVVTVNVGMSGQKCLLAPKTDIGSSLKEFFSIKKVK